MINYKFLKSEIYYIRIQMCIIYTLNIIPLLMRYVNNDIADDK